jgi:hypothetical protein
VLPAGGGILSCLYYALALWIWSFATVPKQKQLCLKIY